MGPRDRTCRAVNLVVSRSPVATSAPAGTVVPSGNRHSTPVMSAVEQTQGRGGTLVGLAPDPIAVNEMISPVWSMGEGSLDAASRTTQCMLSVHSSPTQYYQETVFSELAMYKEATETTHNNSPSVCACTHPTDTVSPSSRLRESLEKVIHAIATYTRTRTRS